MMKLEEQVCSLELAKRLKELGVKKFPLVFWMQIPEIVHQKLNEDGNYVIDKIDYRIKLGNPISWNAKPEDTWPAFTVAELGMILPNHFYSEKFLEGWMCSSKMMIRWERAETEADARAKMLIYLIENKLIEITNE